MFSRRKAPRIELSVVGRTDTGRARTENQDTFLAVELTPSSASEGMLLDPGERPREDSLAGALRLGARGALFLLADGMGGAAGGAAASRLAVTSTVEAIQSAWNPDGEEADVKQFALRLREAIEEANLRIRERARENPELRGMGTTLTGAGVLGRTLVVAQVGDSRGYLLRGERLLQLTRDQSVVQEMIDAGTLSPEKARNSPQRNMILQALGTNSSPELQVVFSHEELRRDDVVLLCSDGLWGMVADDVLSRTVREASDLEEAAERLVEQANAAGGSDNLTVLLVRVTGNGLEPPGDGHDGGETRPGPLRLQP